jgi:citrate lyase beta subunit
MRPRRTFLYTPGDDLKKIQKASRLDVDCVCLDIEDGVAFNRKEAAREAISSALSTFDFGHSERLVRINPVGSGLESLDLEAVLPGQPNGIVIPKVHSVTQIDWADNQISAFEKKNNLPANNIKLIPIIETAMGIVNLREIASSSRRLTALIFGAEDLAGEIGAQRSLEGSEIFYARSAVRMFAAAFDLQAIDMVFIDIQDLEGLRQEALQGARLGFDGKQIIHPNQIPIVKEAFTPGQDEIARAVQIISEYERHQMSGTGVFVLDGKMVDAPLIKSARRLLEKANLFSAIDGKIRA